jgi:hypothetical protein
MGFQDGAVDQIQTVARLGCQRVENPLPDAAPRPAIETIVGRCVGPIALRQVAPRHPGAQHVEYRVHDLAIVNAGTLSAPRHQRLEKSPFVVAQIKSHGPPPSTENHVRLAFSRSYRSTDPSTTLADLLTPLRVANPFSAMRASLRRRSGDEIEDGLAHGGQCWLRRRAVDSFFPTLLF